MAEKSTLRVETYRSPTSVDAERRGIRSGAKAREDDLANKPEITEDDVKSFMKSFRAAPMEAPNEKTITVDDVNEFMKGFSLPGQSKKTVAESGPPVVTKDGVRDSKTGELVVGGKPFTKDDSFLDQARSGVAGLLEGVPVAGPYIRGGIERGAAAIRSLKDGTNFQNELTDIRSRNEKNIQEYPTTNTVGNVTGNIAGTVPLMMAAPAAFGIGGGSLVTNSLVSGVTGAAMGAADSAVRAEDNKLDAAKRGAMIGGAVGALGPAAGLAIGAGVNKLVNVAKGTTPEARNVMNVLKDIDMSPQQVQAELNRMGPNAFIADVDPALAMEAGGLASMGGKPTSTLFNAAKARAATADDTVVRGLETALGSKPELKLVEKQIYDSASAAAKPYYDAMRANPPKLDVTSIAQKIDKELKSAVGGKAANLAKVKDMLVEKTVNTPNGKMIVLKDDAEKLLAVRQEIDGMLEKAPQNADTTAAKGAINALKDLRKEIDNLLKTDSNIATGDAIFAKQMSVKDAVVEGTELFKRATKPDTFVRELAGKTPEQIDGLRTGARIAVGDALEQASRGELAQAKTMFGKSSANRKKLDALFPNAGEIFDLIETEAAKRATENTIISNSLTASRQAVQRKYNPAAGNNLGTLVPALVGEAAGGGIGAVGAASGKLFWDAIKNSFNEASRGKLVGGTAKGLIATGAERDTFIKQIINAQNSDKLSNRLTTGSSLGTNLLTRTTGNRLADQ